MHTMEIMVYVMVAIALLTAAGAMMVFKKKRYPGLLFFSLMMVGYSAFAIYLVNQ
ncbi:hypothetical protein ABC977_12015 [Thioalkalicoccus limnaeus]|uniref:Uncharacterized protein n=1 Tax=Thioalkalicoccus limnaeus TaxID=120681 RepID=A0ABV4BF11_9GAMM